MTQSGNQFEHDDLREALKRAFPAEQAPQALRSRVVAIFRDESAWTGDTMPEPVKLTQPAGPFVPAPYSPAGVAWFGNLFHGARRIAMAACFAGLAMGAAVFVATHNLTSSGPSQVAEAGQVQPFVQAALFRHDALVQASDPTQMPSGSLVPLQQVRTEVEQRTATPMPEADISPQGWRMVGAKSCQAANCCVAQIFYRRGTQTLSVFFIPPDAQGRRIRVGSSNTKDHLIATREAGRFTVCVVGYAPDGRLTAQEVDRVADLIASH